MSDKVIAIDYRKCTGCRICEIACAVTNCGEVNPTKARIRVVRIEEEANLFSLPVVCMKCVKPACKEVCPVGAITDDPTTGARQIDTDKCIGCSACVYACPFGAITVDGSEGFSFTCTHCEGDPACVRFCPVGVVHYLDRDEIGMFQRRIGLERYISYFRRTGGADGGSAQ
jgi:Fe-S-cluster-containing hydrogenase component 2